MIKTPPGRKILLEKKKKSSHSIQPTHLDSPRPWGAPDCTAFCHAIPCLFRSGSQLRKEPVNRQQLCNVPMHCPVDKCTWLVKPRFPFKGLLSIVVRSIPHLPPMTKRRWRCAGTRPPDNPHNHNIGYLYSVLNATTEDVIREVVSSSVMITKSRL